MFTTPQSLPGYFYPGHPVIVQVDPVSVVVLEDRPLLPLAAGRGRRAAGGEAVGRCRDRRRCRGDKEQLGVALPAPEWFNEY